MQIIETPVYSFSELSEEAKENAREWWRNGLEVDYSFVLEDAAAIAQILGIDINYRKNNPVIYFSGFWSQGDGACFEGNYQYKKGASKSIRQHAPQDKELHRIADALQSIQRKHFYKLTASMHHSGFYYHSGCMSVDVEHSEDRYRDIGEAEDDIAESMRDFADWIYKQLEKEHDWQNSDECVDENITYNEFQFTEDGKPFN